MPISKKARVQREHKAAEKAGTRAPVKANGLPVKPPQAHIHRELDYLSRLLTLHLFAIADPYCPTPSYQCQNCRKEIVNTNKLQLEVHAETHDAKNWPKEKCWPNDFQ